MYKKNKGFTLIELLVVVAIIGLLASVVLASLRSARSKAKDAAIISELKELQKLAFLEYSNTGSYTALQNGGWLDDVGDCNTRFSLSGTPPLPTTVVQANAICKNIMPLVGGIPSDSNFNGTFNVGNNTSSANNFSFMAYLPGSGLFACAGSNGFSSNNTYPATGVNWTGSGCYHNP